jgi:hypothetical protein
MYHQIRPCVFNTTQVHGPQPFLGRGDHKFPFSHGAAFTAVRHCNLSSARIQVDYKRL